MNEQLSQLIGAYEAEMQQLKKQLDYCLWEGDVDYQSAYYCKNALQYTQEHLYKLKWLDDSHFYEKMQQMQWIKEYSKKLAAEDSAEMKNYYQRKIEALQQSSELLNPLRRQDVSSSEVLLIDIVKRLMRKEIKNLKLILSQAHHLTVAFVCKLKTVSITLPRIKELVRAKIVGDYQMNLLKKLGFAFDHNGNKLTIVYKGDNEEILNKVSRLISIVVFDVFSYRQYSDIKCYLQYQERN